MKEGMYTAVNKVTLVICVFTTSILTRNTLTTFFMLIIIEQWFPSLNSFKCGFIALIYQLIYNDLQNTQHFVKLLPTVRDSKML